MEAICGEDWFLTLQRQVGQLVGLYIVNLVSSHVRSMKLHWNRRLVDIQIMLVQRILSFLRTIVQVFCSQHTFTFLPSSSQQSTININEMNSKGNRNVNLTAGFAANSWGLIQAWRVYLSIKLQLYHE
jgi:hypothetical protein